MAFIDGQNLYRHAKDAFGYHHPNYDPLKLHTLVCKQYGLTPNLVRFYTGVPRADISPMWDGYWSSRVIALKRAGVLVTTRKIQYHEEKIERPDGSVSTKYIPAEKGIDVRIALDLIKCVRKNQFNTAIIFSQDSDLSEAVDEAYEIAREMQKRIHIISAFPDSATATSRRGINKTTWCKIEKDDYDKCIDPRDYRPQQYR